MTIVYMYRRRVRDGKIDKMSIDEIVSKLASKDISIFEVPARHRLVVNERLSEIQSELDKF